MEYDSDEELYFSWWLDELKETGYVHSYESQPESYVLTPPVFYEYDKHLKTKTNVVVKKLLQEHIYTADAQIWWYEKARGLFFNIVADRVDLRKVPFIASNMHTSIVEIKAGFSKYNMGRTFSLNQKWMMQTHGIYVNKIIISNKTGLFKDTFTPARYLLTDKTNKPRKLYYTPRTLQEYESESQK